MSILRKRLATHLQALAAQVKNPEIVQLNTPLVKPTSICVASTNILLCADEHQRIIQLELSHSGVAVFGTNMREISYPDGVSSIESLCVWRLSAYLAVSGKAGGLYDRGYSNVKQLLRNSFDSCSEIKRLCHYGDVIIFTDIVDRKVKTSDPRTTTVETLMSTGKEGTNDGTGETCTFAQVQLQWLCGAAVCQGVSEKIGRILEQQKSTAPQRASQCHQCRSPQTTRGV